MLFSSTEFIFAFLPAVVLGFFLIAAQGKHQLAILWLIGASLFFYGWWRPEYLALLLASISVNFVIGRALQNKVSKQTLAFGVIFNLGLIGCYKYADFFLDTLNMASGAQFEKLGLALPLAISFFTFQQIAYLVDVYQGKVNDRSFLHYVLFVTFFPQLIAGPIVHHSETIPQFARRGTFHVSWENFSVGGAIFLIGLYKKVVFADGMGVYANVVFDGAESGDALSFFVAWGGILAYSLQIYFDFSGYSDMAIGLARLFGIRLPINFNSPYKAVNIIDFWRRWHMTLSRFLRDYLYYPMGGNRKGPVRRHINIIITMLLGGLWHGAGWTFIFWGGLHGLMIAVNHGWHALRRALGQDPARSTPLGRAAARAVTFFAVCVAWAFFRADTWDGALAVLSGMAGMNGFVLPAGLAGLGFDAGSIAPFDAGGLNWVFILLLVAWFAPNTQEWMGKYEPALDYIAPPGTIIGKGGIAALLGSRQALWLTPFFVISAAVAGLILIARSDSPIFIYMIF